MYSQNFSHLLLRIMQFSPLNQHTIPDILIQIPVYTTFVFSLHVGLLLYRSLSIKYTFKSTNLNNPLDMIFETYRYYLTLISVFFILILVLLVCFIYLFAIFIFQNKTFHYHPSTYLKFSKIMSSKNS